MSIYEVDGRVIAFTNAGALTWLVDGEAPPITPLPLNLRFVVTGHSIPDAIMKGPIQDAIASMGGSAQIFGSTGPFASSEWRWNNRPTGPYEVRGLMEAEGANYDAFMGTEAFGGGNGTTIRDSVGGILDWQGVPGSGISALGWHNLALSAGVDHTYYSNFWQNGLPHSAPVFDAGWRSAQDIEAPLWDLRIDYVNANRAPGTPAMRLVPWLQVFMAVYDGIEAGTVTGITMADCFNDNVHVETSIGRWLLIATFLAVVYRRHPDDLPANAGPQANISTGLAAQLRPIVWSTCLALPRTGLSA